MVLLDTLGCTLSQLWPSVFQECHMVACCEKNTTFWSESDEVSGSDSRRVSGSGFIF